MRWLRLVLVLAVVGCLVVGYAVGKIAPESSLCQSIFSIKLGIVIIFMVPGVFWPR